MKPALAASPPICAAVIFPDTISSPTVGSNAPKNIDCSSKSKPNWASLDDARDLLCGCLFYCKWSHIAGFWRLFLLLYAKCLQYNEVPVLSDGHNRPIYHHNRDNVLRGETQGHRGEDSDLLEYCHKYR